VFDRPVRLARDRGVSPVVGAGLSAWARYSTWAGLLVGYYGIVAAGRGSVV
jgi:hypothetical protein